MRLAGPETTPRAGRSEFDFDTVYREHARTVTRWVVRLGGPRMDAEDLVQDVFVTVNRRLKDFRGDAKITTWLFRITEKTVRNAKRLQRWRRWLHLDPQQSNELPSAVLSPSDLVERRQRVETLYRTLDDLSERDRQVLVLFELEEMSTDEIAVLLGVKVGTVRVWLHRARARFLERQKGMST